MNINLTPSSNSKTHPTASVEKGKTDVSEKSPDTSESFLSKLVALFHGGASEPEDTAKSKAVVPADADASELKVATSDEDKADIDKTDADESDADLSSDHVDELLIQPGEEESTVHKKAHFRKKEAADLVMGEGQEVLSRLKEANQRLVQKDGKELPAADGEGKTIDTTALMPLSEGSKQSADTKLSEETKQPEGTKPSAGILDEAASPLVAQQPLAVNGNTNNGNTNKETAAQLANSMGQEMSQGSRSVSGTDGATMSELKLTEAAKHHALLNQLMQLDARQAPPLNHGGNQPLHPGNSEAATINTTSGIPPSGNSSEMNASLLALQGQNAISANAETEQWSKNQILETLRHKNGAALASVSGHTRGESMAQHLSSMMGQQTGGAMTQARADQVQNPTSVYLAKDGAADQLAERVHMMMSKNLKNIDIRLDPPELGKMHIRMNMTGDQTTVHFTVANQQVRDVLENSMSRLRDMLTQQGVQLGETTVQHQGANQQQGYPSSGHEQSMVSTSHIKDSLFPEDNLETDVKLDLNIATKRDGISYYA